MKTRRSDVPSQAMLSKAFKREVYPIGYGIETDMAPREVRIEVRDSKRRQGRIPSTCIEGQAAHLGKLAVVEQVDGVPIVCAGS